VQTLFNLYTAPSPSKRTSNSIQNLTCFLKISKTRKKFEKSWHATEKIGCIRLGAASEFQMVIFRMHTPFFSHKQRKVQVVFQGLFVPEKFELLKRLGEF
jgi:hypothetical protein